MTERKKKKRDLKREASEKTTKQELMSLYINDRERERIKNDIGGARGVVVIHGYSSSNPGRG